MVAAVVVVVVVVAAVVVVVFVVVLEICTIWIRSSTKYYTVCFNILHLQDNTDFGNIKPVYLQLQSLGEYTELYES